METYKSFDLDFSSVNDGNFVDIALQVFHFQVENNSVYKEFARYLGIDPKGVTLLSDIPFLPISFFKSHVLKTGAWSPEGYFSSSGTTGPQTSSHAVRDVEFYLRQARRCFEHFFGDVREYHFFALLPSYLERKDSSLVAMIDYFIRESGSALSGFYLHNTDQLLEDLRRARDTAKKSVLWGVTFALLDLAERYHPDLSHCMVFETGGMKGKRPEITRPELHQVLSENFRVSRIFSEYGMTELFSQAYTRGGHRFFCPPWLKIVARDVTDPLQKGLLNETGGINVVDLANVDTIAFIETEDLGKVYADGSFEILGRLDNSDLRGCNLLVE